MVCFRYDGGRKDQKGNPVVDSIQAKDGKWIMQKKQFISGRHLERWGLLNISKVNPKEADHFIDCLYHEGQARGLKIEFPKIKESVDPFAPWEKITPMFEKIVKGIPGIQMVMVFSEAKGPIYAHIKFLGDVIYGIPTQFVMKKNVLGKQRGPDPQTIHNICLKINSKLGTRFKTKITLKFIIVNLRWHQSNPSSFL